MVRDARKLNSMLKNCSKDIFWNKKQENESRGIN